MRTRGFDSNRERRHEYVERRTGAVRTERLIADRAVRWLYDRDREHPSLLLRALTSPWFTAVLGHLRYDLYLGNRRTCGPAMLRALQASLDECVDDPATLDSPRRVFERRIRYWDCRPMPEPPDVVVSPADARVLLASLEPSSLVFLKQKFFALEELLGSRARPWLQRFRGADVAVFRLTPDRYHYNHMPVAGLVTDFDEIEGACHSCNPHALLRVAAAHAKNRRTVTFVDTDVTRGSQVGLVAMVEVAALMIGEIVQCYSQERYLDPQPVQPGQFLCRGAPKSLFRPGSSTVVLLFEPGRVVFDDDLVRNSRRTDVCSRFSVGLGRSLVESDVEVRSRIGQGRRGIAASIHGSSSLL